MDAHGDVQMSRYSNSVAQIKAMMKKHLIFKKRAKKMFAWELGIPIYMGGIVYLVLNGQSQSKKAGNA